MIHFVHSTLTNAHRYTNWTRPTDPTLQPEIIPDPVVIKGGANLATSPESNMGRRTPRSVVTQVTDKQLEYLRANKVFNRHEKQERIFVLSSKENSEKVARDMNPKDAAAPLTPSDPHFNKPETEEGDKPLRARIKDTVSNAVSRLSGGSNDDSDGE